MAIRHREVFPVGSAPDSISWEQWNDDHVGVAGAITQDQQDALDAANAPAAGNPFATIADVGAGGGLEVIGPFTVNYNTPNILTTGATLWTPAVGDLIMAIWPEPTTPFAGSGGWASTDSDLFTANDDWVNMSPIAVAHFTFGQNESIAVGVDSDLIQPADILPQFEAAGQKAGFIRMKAAVPIKVKFFPNAGTMTAGQADYYALVLPGAF